MIMGERFRMTAAVISGRGGLLVRIGGTREVAEDDGSAEASVASERRKG